MEQRHFEELTDAELEQITGGDGINIFGDLFAAPWKLAGDLAAATGDFWGRIFSGVGDLVNWG